MNPSSEDQEVETRILHVHDLPQLYTKPSAQTLIQTLQLLRKSSNGFDADRRDNAQNVFVDPSGIPRYLTYIIASSLKWLEDSDREQVWELASTRLSERSGRNAAPSMTRSFRINSALTLNLHEPSLTEDSLGLKTWTSSLLLAKRLDSLSHHIPPDRPRVLELGAGTGLVGLAAASIREIQISEVLLTDLPEIVPNLQQNIDANSIGAKANVKVGSKVLDWSDDSVVPESDKEGYPLILAADPIYTKDHARTLVGTVSRWLTRSPVSRFMLELPLRAGYQEERDELQARLEEFMEVIEEGKEVGYDDWEGADGRPAEVECWWSVWRLKVFN